VDPIMVMYRHNEEIDSLLSQAMQRYVPIVLDSTSTTRSCSLDMSSCPDPEHLLWSVEDKEDVRKLQKAFEAVDALYIADGHHRTAAALK
jgi:uncharacterized protein (DUF1015 family)